MWQVVMLYQLAPGPCTQSFGIHVAQTAEFPPAVIAEARRKAHCLEQPSAPVTAENKEGTIYGYTATQVQDMRAKLQTFSALDVPHLPAEQLVQHVQDSFGAGMVGAF
jgi:DNA mismatch repair ATPase MutS